MSSSGDSSSVSSSNFERRSHHSSSGGSSSCAEYSSTSNSTGTGNRSIPEELAAKETRAVKKSRAVFVLLLSIFAAAAATLTFIFSSKEETDDFDTQFHDFAFEIEDVTHHNAHNTYGSIHGFADTVTSFASFAAITYPDLTIPHFDIRARHLMESTGVDFVALSPVVNESNRTEWERYAATSHAWVAESLGVPLHSLVNSSSVPLHIHDEAGIVVGQGDFVFESDFYHVPAWQMSPLTEDALHVINFDLLTHPLFHRIFYYIEAIKEPVFSEVVNITSLFGANAPDFDGHPQSLLVQPVFRGFGNDTKADEEVVAVLTVVIPWDLYFTNLLHEGAGGIVIVLEDSCGDAFTYRVDGPEAHFLGAGDLHQSKYDHVEFITEFEPFDWHEVSSDELAHVNCHYFFKMYPSAELEDEYKTKKPIYLTLAVLLVFMATTGAFAAYDCMVRKRQERVMDSAMKSNAIVSSLFPAEVRDRLFSSRGSRRKKKKLEEEMKKRKRGGLLPTMTEAPKFRLNHFLSDGGKAHPVVDDEVDTKPIADLFAHCTVMFGDIVGFTAWSSVREPSQVFILLETLYRGFDHIAKRRHVFKVETIGDCYVAVTGLPEPRDDHALVMARFARDCLLKMKVLTTKLEVTLGPDTGDLTMRFGLNSGPVTAGVLRGEKSRFQLFGDTVNTAARMEATGEANRIHISDVTARLLQEKGKENWFVPREDSVWAKGKGEMQTYWLHAKLPKSRAGHSTDDDEHDDDDSNHDAEDPRSPDVNVATNSDKIFGQDVAQGEDDSKRHRMIGWNVDVLLRLLKQVVANRNASTRQTEEDNNATVEAENVARLESVMTGGVKSVEEDVTEFVELPKFDFETADLMEDPEKIELKPEAEEQLRLFVSDVSTMYRSNPFHNFEHASHVLMSVSKLLGRIVAADVAPGEKERGQQSILSRLHDRTYGITSDPLTQFAVVLSALIHDVDHVGVPNFVLINENPEMAALYNCRSVAEQNSFNLAWYRLMEPDMADLRACIYTTTEELDRFYQTVVNTVMATDIFDKGFAELRKKRWDRCFHSSEIPSTPNGELDVINRKATIVIEHVIQASDVAHTMQHWQIYQRWNERLFQEMYTAYKTGRSSKDPTMNWYESELGFFDNYVIPLAKKLKECGVFGVSSDEYLNYALQNRMEWSNRGKSIVSSCVSRFQSSDGELDV